MPGAFWSIEVDPVFVDTQPFGLKEFTMMKRKLPYPTEFRRQMVELARSGRTPEELAREFGPTAQSIRKLGCPVRP